MLCFSLGERGAYHLAQRNEYGDQRDVGTRGVASGAEKVKKVKKEKVKKCKNI